MCITQLVGANNVLRKATFVTCLEAHKISAVYLLLSFFFLHIELVVNTLLYIIKFHHYYCISLHFPFPTSSTSNTHKAIEYALGVPLVLKVLGHHLCGNSKEVWESAMRKLEIIPHVDILKVLKISYDSLDDSQKNVFLDIACLLEGEHRDEVTSFFDASGFQAKIELSVLEDKSLITCLNNQIRMHDLLRDMGREIVRNESIDLPGKRSRLWYHKDIDEVLKKNTVRNNKFLIVSYLCYNYFSNLSEYVFLNQNSINTA